MVVVESTAAAGEADGLCYRVDRCREGVGAQGEIALAIIEIEAGREVWRAFAEFAAAACDDEVEVVIAIHVDKNALHVFLVFDATHQRLAYEATISLLEPDFPALVEGAADEEIHEAIAIEVAGADKRTGLGEFLREEGVEGKIIEEGFLVFEVDMQGVGDVAEGRGGRGGRCDRGGCCGCGGGCVGGEGGRGGCWFGGCIVGFGFGFGEGQRGIYCDMLQPLRSAVRPSDGDAVDKAGGAQAEMGARIYGRSVAANGVLFYGLHRAILPQPDLRADTIAVEAVA